ncbi:hypothetical protein GF356_10910, partial [candidate division GN15 bacterium]|nr:hypothetical protein [candidate division GN15 bacterium]
MNSFYRCIFTATITVVLVLIVLSASLLGSTRTADLEMQMQQLAGRSRGLALTVLKQLKAFDQKYRIDGEPDRRRLAEANQELWKTRLLVDAFNGARAEFETASDRFDRYSGEATSDEKASVKKLTALMSKYERLINKYYGAAIDDFGEPVQQRPEYVTRTTDGTVLLSGEANFGLGLSKYKRQTAGIDFGGGDFQFGVKGTFKPSPGFNINAFLDHTNTNERVDYSLTNFGANTGFFFSRYAAIRGGFGYQAYSLADNDAAGYGQLRLHGDFDYKNPLFRFNAGIELNSRGYEDDALDYSTTAFHAQAIKKIGQGHLKGNLKYLTREPDNEILKANDLDLRAEYRVPSGRFEIGGEYRKISFPELPEVVQGQTAFGITYPRDKDKIKVRFEWLRDEIGNSSRRGFHGIWYSFPSADDSDFYDIMYKSTGRARKNNRLKSNRLTLMYRLHQDSLAHDYAQFRWSRNGRPIGLGTYSTTTIVLRAYTTFTDEDDPFRYAKLPPPNTVDFYWSFGWSKTGNGALKNISIGPLVGASFAIDPERQDAYDPDDINYIFPNPANEAKVGVESQMVWIISGLIRWNVNARYEFQTYYAADPVRTKHNIVIRSTFGYRINKNWGIDGKLNVHETRVDVDSPADLN